MVTGHKIKRKARINKNNKLTKLSILLAFFLFILMLSLFAVSNPNLLGRSFSANNFNWESRLEISADPSEKFISTHVIFGKYKPSSCRDGIYVETADGQPIPFSTENELYEGGLCKETDVVFSNLIYQEPQPKEQPSFQIQGLATQSSITYYVYYGKVEESESPESKIAKPRQNQQIQTEFQPQAEFTTKGWAYPEMAYRAAVIINNTLNSNTLTDYQVFVTLDTASLISSGKLRSDCGDIRFADSDDSPLSYWLESGCNTASTKIWVKVPNIPASSTKTIYVYYGNSSVTSASNGDATFDFFDDFNDGVYNTSKWAEPVQGPGQYQESNGVLNLTVTGSTGPYRALTKTFTMQNGIVEMKVKWISTTGTSHMMIYIRQPANGGYGEFTSRGGTLNDIYFNDGAQKGTKSFTPNQNQWHFMQFKINGPNAYGYIKNLETGSQASTSISNFAISGAGYLGPGVWNAVTTIFVDDFRVRKFTDPEPTTVVIANAIEACTNITSSSTWPVLSDLSGTQSSGKCLDIQADNVTIDCAGHSITGALTGYGIYSQNHNNVALRNCVIKNYTYGTYFSNTGNITITNSQIANNVKGIELISTNNSNITLNNISQNLEDGIEMQSSSYNRITSNFIANQLDDGVDIDQNSNFNFISQNTFLSNVYGTMITQANGNTIFNNSYVGNINASVGIYATSSNNNITKNNISGSIAGIAILLANENTIESNNVFSNSVGLALNQSSSNTIKNNIIYNSSILDIFITTNSLDNNFINQTIAGQTQSTYPVSFDFSYFGDLGIKGVDASPPPLSGSNYSTIGKFINATNLSSNAWLSLNIRYKDSEIGRFDENSLTIARYNGTWETNCSNFANGCGVDTVNNIIYANITDFGSIFAPVAEPLGCFNGSYYYVCGETITTSCTLVSNLTSSGTCFTVGADNIVIDGAGYTITGTSSGSGVLIQGRTNITVKNLKIDNFGFGILANSSVLGEIINCTVTNSNTPDGAIAITKSSNYTVFKNTVIGSFAPGIVVYSSYNNITDNYLDQNADFGIYIGKGSTYNYVANNYVTRTVWRWWHSSGIHITTWPDNILNLTHDNVVFNNTVLQTSQGIWVYYSLNNSVLNNFVSNNQYNIYSENSQNISISNNKIVSGEYGIFVTASNNLTISNNSINSSSSGIYLATSPHNDLINNDLYNANHHGIVLTSSGQNILINNSVRNSYSGIELSYSYANTLLNNKLNNNTYNFGVWGEYYQNISTSNTVDGLPIYYWTDETGPNGCNNAEISGAGFVGLISCNNILVQNSNLKKTYNGFIVYNSNNITLRNLNVSEIDEAMVYDSTNVAIYSSNFSKYSEDYNTNILVQNIENFSFANNNLLSSWLETDYSTGLNIANNTFKNYEGECLYIYDSEANISNNYFYKCGNSTNIYYSTANVTNNTIKESLEDGLVILGYSYVDANKNALIGNTENALVFSSGEVEELYFHENYLCRNGYAFSESGKSGGPIPAPPKKGEEKKTAQINSYELYNNSFCLTVTEPYPNQTLTSPPDYFSFIVSNPFYDTNCTLKISNQTFELLDRTPDELNNRLTYLDVENLSAEKGTYDWAIKCNDSEGNWGEAIGKYSIVLPAAPSAPQIITQEIRKRVRVPQTYNFVGPEQAFQILVGDSVYYYYNNQSYVIKLSDSFEKTKEFEINGNRYDFRSGNTLLFDLDRDGIVDLEIVLLAQIPGGAQIKLKVVEQPPAPPKPLWICGDGKCEGDESPLTCPQDCPAPERVTAAFAKSPYFTYAALAVLATLVISIIWQELAKLRKAKGKQANTSKK